MTLRSIIISSLIFGTLGVVPVQSQIVTDGTTDTSVTNNCQSLCNINDGTVAGQNLFHSFEEFNIAPKAKVYFADPGVANIFSRITGANPSEIFGTLGVKGDANLFLLNPNGIIFGNGATLDLNGSFFATTADAIQFGDRNFAAIPSPAENLALLTINPNAFLFNRQLAGSINLNRANLTVPEAKNITLFGRGDSGPGIELNNSKISASQGNINLGAVGGLGKIEFDNNSIRLPDSVARGDLALTSGSAIESDDSGQIEVDVRDLTISENSYIFSITRGDRDGANININARSLNIMGESNNAFQTFLADNLTLGGNVDLTQSRIQTTTIGEGDAGDIKIKTANLSIENGAGVISTTRDRGDSGNIDLNVAENIALSRSGLLSVSGTLSFGDVGEIEIETKRLSLRDRGVISSSTLGSGNAGKITIDATEKFEISNTPARSIIPTGVFTNTVFGSGAGGNLEINTPQLTLHNGGQLSASNGAVTVNESGLYIIPLGGAGGNIELNISKSLKITGLSEDRSFPSSILSDTRTTNPAGNLTINTVNLLLDDNGLISASSIGTGAGGDINITARDSIELKGTGTDNLRALISDGLNNQFDSSNIQGGIAAFTLESGVAGEIAIDTATLSLKNGAVISTASFGGDDAGNLKINASEAIDVRGSAIISPTFGRADGGTLDLNTKNFKVTQGGAVVSASVGSGRAGNLNIRATESIAVSDVIPNTLFSGSISTGNYSGFGSSGDLQIDTKRLKITNGANIQTNNIFLVSPAANNAAFLPSPASPGQLTINATESIEISGSTTSLNSFNQTPNSNISSFTTTANPASNVTINTGELVLDRGEINVSSLGQGTAGTLEINADSVTLKDEANLKGTTNSGLGGNVALKVADLLSLENGSVINTNAAVGSGGDIKIDAEFVIAAENSSITANAAASGNGGAIEIIANDVFLAGDSVISANSALGIDGTVRVRTLVDSERNTYAELPQQVIQTDSRIIRSCGSNRNRQGVFSYTGRGGLPSNPLTEFSTSNITVADLEIPPTALTDNRELEQYLDSIPSPVVEADSWQINPQGEIELTAAAGDAKLFDPSPANCPLSYKYD